MAESMERVNRLVRERPEVAAAILERWAQRGVVSS
jgi:flagellar biosynthesis/type III secretory pathway M-ring protein FliF/YscJ